MPRLNKKTRRLWVSSTEMQTFQSCRRRWYLTRLYTGTTDAPAFIFGQAIHKGLEGYFTAKKNAPDNPETWKAATVAFYIEHCIEEKEKAKKQYGMLWGNAEPAFNDLYELGRKVLVNYIDFDAEADIPIYPRIVEKRLFIPMDRYGNDILAMRWDVMGSTHHDMTAIIDHKTTSGSIIARGAVLDLDEQLTSYAYGYWRVHERERMVDEVIYDTVNKKIPAPIRVLKDGKLSTDKSQDTIMPILVRTVEQFGDDLDRFADLISVLEEKGWSSYFRREESPRNETQLRNYEERAQMIFNDMRACIEDPKLAYPSPGPIKCPTCPFLNVCSAMEMGEDYEYLLQVSFVRHAKTPYSLPPRFKEMTG